jgi:hypothetical protein
MTTRLLITLSVLVAACSCFRSSSLPAPASLAVVAKNGSATPELRGGADDSVGAGLPAGVAHASSGRVTTSAANVTTAAAKDIACWERGNWNMDSTVLIKAVADVAKAAGQITGDAVTALMVDARNPVSIESISEFDYGHGDLYTTDRCKLDEVLCFQGCSWYDPKTGEMNGDGSSEWCMTGGLAEGNMFCLVDYKGQVDWTCAGVAESSAFRPTTSWIDDGVNFKKYTLLAINVKRSADSGIPWIFRAGSHQMQITRFAYFTPTLNPTYFPTLAPPRRSL